MQLTPKRQKRKNIFFWGVLLFLGFGLLLASHFNLLNKPKNIFFLIISPVSRAFSSAGAKTANLFHFFINLKKIIQDNQWLRSENLQLISQTAKLNDLIRENEFLRQALDAEQSSGQKMIFAKIISRYDLLGQQAFTIDKGLKNGVNKGQAVVLAPNILIGQVVESLDNFASVRPVTNSNSQIQVVVNGKQIPGIIKGQENNILVMEMVPQDKELSVGDLLVSSPTDQLVGDLLVGKVEQVFKNDLGVFQQALVKPLATSSGINSVIVVASANP